ncbi:MAG: HAD-IIIC family phosphatase [Desulfuromonadales bacterium]|nr:HAD-IIIC family phosphatase [Desulfuromonadales bacterium]
MDNKVVIEQIKACDQFSEIGSLLTSLDRKRLTSQNIISLSRALRLYQDPGHVNIAYLANFTVDLLPPYVEAFAATEGLLARSYVGKYNQYFQEVLSEESGLSGFEPDLIFLTLSLLTLEPELKSSFLQLSVEDKNARIERIVQHFQQWVSAVKQRYSTTVLISNFPLPAFSQLGIADANDPFGEMAFYFELNKRLAAALNSESRAHVFDLAKLSARFGSDNVFDPKMHYMAKLAWGEKFLPLLADEMLRHLLSLKGLTRKCLVLDLDNTLWGGVLGEEGPSGVKVGPGDPVSEAYHDFQCKIKNLKDRGVMLAVCSKNNESDVREMFAQRSAMPLGLDDFAALKINWEHKHLNIERIAKELNIGLDSLVFIDDNPVECELVRQMLPQVRTYLVPGNPENIPRFVDEMIEFEKLMILADDRNKTRQYQQERKREELKGTVGDLSDYLQSLETELEIRVATQHDLNRVQQLFAKTNQFNVTTKRYSMAEVERFHAGDGWELGVAAARDKFGDLGIIGLYLLHLVGSLVEIDSFILSCRAMGRGIETAMMNHIKLQHAEAASFTARYFPTSKNMPVKNFFPEQGFEVVEKNAEQVVYSLDMKENKMLDCTWINVV